ncbi:MAG: hypothetical protein Q7U38_13385 [Methylobacter sp.]|nr:hypothetical protein [Methylobacter sp.]MDP2100469.1 hypothetical protein [Methylobacter sp.]MDP2428329.1 hypothetical protein [Methylobacter sp.]MDP3055680.1 hypothetical protein [Methylobacter sp.]MDP3361384.1 hypothetical protein [Methylobacter sp.]
MTESDFQSVYKTTPTLVGKRVGLSVENLSEDELLRSIKQKDADAFKFMQDFRATYQEWWNLSKKLAEEKQENLSILRAELEKQIFKRDEIRKALVSYLNFKYGKANG